MTKKEILEVTENIQKLRKPRTYRVGIALWNEHEIEAFSEDEALKIAEEIEVINNLVNDIDNQDEDSIPF